MNLFSIFEKSAQSWPDDTALVQDGHALTYREMLVSIQRIAGELTRIGVQPGEKVCIAFPRCIEYVLSCLAVLRLDAVAVPISSALKRDEIASLTADTEVDAFCYASSLRDTVPVGDENRRLSLVPFPKSTMAIELKPSAGPASTFPMRQRLKHINAAYICFSSGTTAKSKGIVLSHEALYERATRRLDVPPVARDTSILWLRALDRFVPNQFTAAFCVGGKVVIGNSFDFDQLPRLICDYAINQIWAPPPYYRALLHAPIVQNALAPIRQFLSSGAALPANVANAFHDKFGKDIMQNYGSAECAPIFINASGNPAKRASVGIPVEGREVKLVPPGAEIEIDAAEGELLVRGDGMLHAYYKPWRSREEIFDHGWLHTGDLARRDADGYYWIVGRIKETINIGGANVFPSEIEEILLSHPDVEDCLVYGVADDRHGEVPNAKVKLRSGHVCREKDLLLFVNDRLSVFKALRKITLTDKIEKTVTGKSKRW